MSVRNLEKSRQYKILIVNDIHEARSKAFEDV